MACCFCSLFFIFILHFFSARRAEVIFKTGFTAHLFTTAAFGDAVATDEFLAVRALATAAQADGFLALAAICGALVAIVMLAVLAEVSVF